MVVSDASGDWFGRVLFSPINTGAIHKPTTFIEFSWLPNANWKNWNGTKNPKLYAIDP